jgi:DNA-binding transcriptional regulator YiaG
MEEAVVELMTGTEAPKAIATRLGVTLAELRHWERVFREAGRAALASLPRT